MSFLIRSRRRQTMQCGKKRRWKLCRKGIVFQKTKRQGSHMYSLQEISSICSPTDVEERLSGRTFLQISLQSCRRAGMVVEAAMLLPLFLLAVLTMMSFMNIYSIQTEKLTILCQNVKTAGMYAFAAGGDEDAEITLPSLFSYQAPFSVIPLPKLWMTNKVKVRAWTGALYTEEADTESEAMVFVTENGSVYHAKDCSYLNPSVQQITGDEVENLRNQNGGKYYACDKCSQGQEPGIVVYVTRNGTRYHNSLFCTSLKRMARMVKLSDVQNKMSPCSKCKGG